MAQVFIGSTHNLSGHDRGRGRLLDRAYDAAARVADLGDDGTSDLTMSEVIPTGELESWCPAERSVDTTRRLGRLGRWPDVAGPRRPFRPPTPRAEPLTDDALVAARSRRLSPELL